MVMSPLVAGAQVPLSRGTLVPAALVVRSTTIRVFYFSVFSFLLFGFLVLGAYFLVKIGVLVVRRHY